MLPDDMTHDEYYDSAAEGRRPTSDFEWYAVDREGHVAFLTSGGMGAIPLLVFRDKTGYYAAAEYFRNLSVRCGHVLHGNHASRLTSWIDAARRGLFAFDWDASTAGQYVPGQPYQLIAAPERPITSAELRLETREWISPIRFDADFAVAKKLFPEQDFDKLNLPESLVKQAREK